MNESNDPSECLIRVDIVTTCWVSWQCGKLVRDSHFSFVSKRQADTSATCVGEANFRGRPSACGFLDPEASLAGDASGGLVPPMEIAAMYLKKWEPLREMDDLLDRYVRVIGWPNERSRETTTNGDWMPRVDISETEESYAIHAELPAVKKEDVHVTVESGVLTIKGERKQESSESGRKFHRIERSYGSFVRSFTLPESVDADSISATFQEGVLNLTIPKRAKAISKSIDIKVE